MGVREVSQTGPNHYPHYLPTLTPYGKELGRVSGSGFTAPATRLNDQAMVSETGNRQWGSLNA